MSAPKMAAGAARRQGAFFDSETKGETHELRMMLSSNQKERVREGLRKVIGGMTLGKDMSELFPVVRSLMVQSDLQMKKLAFLYVINLAPAHPREAAAAVANFKADCAHHNPLIRGLAIRSISSINLPEIHEHMTDILKLGMTDPDPYVRKTSVNAVAKLWRQVSALVESGPLLDGLRNVLGQDDNAMVMASAACVFQELQQCTGKPLYQTSEGLLKRLLIAMNEANEWSLVYLLEAVAGAKDLQVSPALARDVVNRVKGRLKHSNAAIVLATARVLLKFLDLAEDEELREKAMADLAPSLITLLNEHAPEIKFVTLRNLNIIVQAYPRLFAGPRMVNHFFCKYDDPYYVKIEKLEIMIRLANLSNVKEILFEFKDYAREVDVEFVRRSVLAIGRCAIKLDQAAENCVKMLLDLIQESQRPGARTAEANFVVQEALVVIRDIFRKYPNRYERIISTLCEYLETLDEPGAKAALIWIVGEYSDRIDNSPELLEQFLLGWSEEPAAVRLALLTACVKLYLKRPADGQPVCLSCLKLATEREDNPDLRDRGYMYWRLIGMDPVAAQKVVLAERPAISDSTFSLEKDLLGTLMENLSSLASVYYKDPVHFVSNRRFLEGHFRAGAGAGAEEVKDDYDSDAEAGGIAGAGGVGSGPMVDSSAQITADILDLAGLDLSTWDEPQAASVPQLPELVSAAEGHGLRVTGEWVRAERQLQLHLVLENQSQTPLSQFAMRFNRNLFGLAAAGQPQPGTIAPGASAEVFVPCIHSPEALGEKEVVEIALKSQLGVNIFGMAFSGLQLLDESGALFREDKKGYIQLFGTLPNELKSAGIRPHTQFDGLATALEKVGVYLVASPKNRPTPLSYYSSKHLQNNVFFEVAGNADGSVTVSAKSDLDQVRLRQLLAGVAGVIANGF